MKLRLVVSAALVLLLPAALALAGTRIDSKVSLGLGPHVGQFAGVVQSKPICVSGRTVKVIRVDPGPRTVVAKTGSDINGIWKKRTNESSGSWVAKVTRDRRQGVLCLGDRSPVRSAG